MSKSLIHIYYVPLSVGVIFRCTKINFCIQCSIPKLLKNTCNQKDEDTAADSKALWLGITGCNRLDN